MSPAMAADLLRRWRSAGSVSTRFLLGGLSELCFPPACVLCHGPLEIKPLPAYRSGNSALCPDCDASLLATAAVAACDRCARPQPPRAANDAPPQSTTRRAAADEDPHGAAASHSGEPNLCPPCRKGRSKIDRTVALGMYRDVMREAVIAAKRRAFQPLALGLGELLGERVRSALGATPIGAVTFIPSHWTRRFHRGGCPAQLLARQVGRAIGAPVLPLLRCTRRTAKQGTLGDADRGINVRGAFTAKKNYALLVPRVLVVDDVWTTGSTLQEAAGVIRQAYDAEVFAAVVARAIGTHLSG